MDSTRTILQALPILARRLEDLPGPRYVETDLSRTIVEPFNALSAGLFLFLAGWWILRLWPRRRHFAFLLGTMPLLIIGGVGGTVYHAFRGHRAWLLMDWIPIALLTFAAGVYLWARLLRRWWYALVIPPLVFAIQSVNFRTLPRGLAINASYSLLAAVVIVPAGLVLIRTRGRHGAWFLTGVAAFIAALSCRALDWRLARLLPMGSHWLWHVFGAVACHFCLEYLYRLRSDEVLRQSQGALEPSAS
jgi:hemolysin III